MKKLFAVPVAALVAVGLVACSESPTESYVPQFELVEPTIRIAAEDVNAHVYGSFSLSFDVSAPGGIGVILTGPANFPGNPKNAGTCDNGLWINSQGKRTSGNLDKPHPHCVGETEGGTSSIKVVLEPISVHNGGTAGAANEWLQFAVANNDGRVHVTGSGESNWGTQAQGVLTAYAIDAATINSASPTRVGILTIDLDQYKSTGGSSVNYFTTGCTIDGAPGSPRCLNKVIGADYEPLAAPDGVGSTTANVQGFLYWAAATSPFNYGSE